ncbi:UNVERIFIED_CONTAM: hypothetical protein PYX00_002822 [Menopon gallinae]|uniref:Uncharacterized protein n=1 Tax=Menopon gallinae TaxID=328185 RepID=A0AAW2HZS1_9NEOP
MVVLILVLYVFPPCLGFDGKARPKSKAKVIEDYVLSANFDDGMALPQIRGRTPDRTERGIERKIADLDVFRQAYQTEEESTGPGPYHEMKDRDLVLPPHGPHHPPPPAVVISPQAFFAMGFMNFLILLSIMQASIAVMSKNSPAGGGLLGGLLGKPPGRRRRSAPARALDLR